MDTPVVLKEARKISAIGIRNQQWLSGLTAAYSDREEQIVIVDLSVAIAIEVRKILDHFNAPLLKDTQIKIRIDTLNFAAKVQALNCSLSAVLRSLSIAQQ